MARNRRKSKGRADSSGGHGALPRNVWRHPDYQKLSGNAVKLLMDFACQYNGRNNGDLTAALSVLKQRGWRSRTTIKRASTELLIAGMIVRTREGRFLNPGGVCELFAVTWRSIDECPGKDLAVEPTNTPPRKFSVEDIKMSDPHRGHGSDQKRYPSRARDKSGKYVSVHNRDRLRAVPCP